MHANKYVLVVVVTLLTSVLSYGQSPTQRERRGRAAKDDKLPPGYVQGDVVSYSYVPNRYWSLEEGVGICPYLFEYGLIKWDNKKPLADFHEENIRRIDMVSKWSTCIQLTNRYAAWNDEVINLMIRCFKNRQLIILSARPDSKPDKEKDYFGHLVAILEKLWANRDTELVSPEGDKATGRQLINNILMADTGDEGLTILKTHGLYALNERVREEIKERKMGRERPFRHIKTWYNEMHYGMGTYAANKEDLNKKDPNKGPQKWPSNSEFIGVDTYHYWGFDNAPFDPMDPSIPRERIMERAKAWQDVITRYYGPDFRVTTGPTWEAKHRNDTHAMIQAIDLANAKRAMMVYIANSDYIPGTSYTTPIETMDAFYDSIKAGPWVGLAWWVFDNNHEGCRTLDYIDKTLRRWTPQPKKDKTSDKEKDAAQEQQEKERKKKEREGVLYPEEVQERLHKQFIESRMRIFNDVVYNQFGHLNGPAPKDNPK